MIPILLFVLILLYAAEMGWLYAGIQRAGRCRRVEDYEPAVSVIVAARNEEEYIAGCLRSLLKLEYPREKLEIIIVNDSSTDRTGEILSGFPPDPRIRILQTTPGSGNLHGKANALAAGIRGSHGEIILLTDADCTVRPGWVRETVKYFTPGTGIVGGFTVLEGSGAFSGIQALDWFFLFNVAAGTAGWRYPLTVIGNNFAVRREAYEAAGGYEAIPFSVTEDYALVRSIVRTGRFGVEFPRDAACSVESRPCRNAGHLFRQKQRWGVGGLDMILGGMLIMAVSWCTRVMVIAALLYMPLTAGLVSAALLCVTDLCFLTGTARRFGAARRLGYFPLFELYLTFYALLIPFVALFSRKIIWKHRSL